MQTRRSAFVVSMAALIVTACPVQAQNLPVTRPPVLQAPLRRPLPINQRLPLGSGLVTASQIPAVQDTMPVLKLSVTAPPEDFVREILKASVPAATPLAPHANSAFVLRRRMVVPQAVFSSQEGDRIAAFVHRDTGQAEVFPNFEAIKPIQLQQRSGLSDRALTLARQVFARPGILSRDDTRFEVANPLPLVGASFSKDPSSGKVSELSPAQPYLTYVPVRRLVGQFQVSGPGSHAVLAVGENNTIHGFSRNWKNAVIVDRIKETRSRDQIASEINAQVTPLTQTGNVSVDRVDLAYYDGGKDYMQPVYRFSVTVHEPQNQGKPADDNHLLGYVPVGQAREALPVLSKAEGEQPRTAALLNEEQIKNPQVAAVPPGDPTVGRYVVRADDADWTNDANEFWNGLTSFGGGSLFSNSQYYWAEPRLFTTQKQSFLNSVQVALTEVHGNWWYFTTYKNYGEGVSISDIPYPGLGAAAGGKLCYWILHSCEVIPSPVDVPSSTDPSYGKSNWWDNWFNVFGGLHSVVGYRTVMYINDDAGYPFGQSLRLGVPVVSAWLNTVSSLSAYNGRPTYDTHGSTNKPMGRACTISMAGHVNDSVYDTADLPRAGQLTTFWFPN